MYDYDSCSTSGYGGWDCAHRLDCLVLLSHALATDKAWILANLDLILTTRQQSIFASLIHVLPNTLLAYQMLPTSIELAIANSTAK